MSETQTQIYGVSLPMDVAHRARVLAATQGKSRSGLMRDLLMEYLNKYDLSTFHMSSPAFPSKACESRNGHQS
jgi:metal-responsive CopG/Arc/MetJ family transcriptional regulator